MRTKNAKNPVIQKLNFKLGNSGNLNVNLLRNGTYDVHITVGSTRSTGGYSYNKAHNLLTIYKECVAKWQSNGLMVLKKYIRHPDFPRYVDHGSVNTVINQLKDRWELSFNN